MKIIHICSELAKIAKVGGLADVVYGLSKAISEKNMDVEVLLPKYDCMDLSPLKNLHIEKERVISYEGMQKIPNTLWSAELDTFKVSLLEPHHPAGYFTRGKIYGCEDDIDRFVYFCRAAMETIFKCQKKPDIIHLHDWPSALCAPLQKEMYNALSKESTRVLFTIHNMSHQGICSPITVSKAGLDGERYLSPDRMQDPSFPHLLNLLKGGMIYSDIVTTVSPTYREEILSKEGGCRLDRETKSISHKLYGILNGIDYSSWDPETDSHLVKTFSTKNSNSEESMSAILEAKKENRAFIQLQLGLEPKCTPLVVCISRLVRQKGPELIREALIYTVEKQGQFILLCSNASVDLEQEFIELKNTFKNDANVAIWFDHDERLAHLLYAAGDILIVPSLFEPCGLTQMIALRYGTIPIVRETGGLADTIFDIDTGTAPEEARTGFTFKHPDAVGIRWALGRALDYKIGHSQKWHTLMQNGFKKDFSWKHSAEEYIKLYKMITHS